MRRQVGILEAMVDTLEVGTLEVGILEELLGMFGKMVGKLVAQVLPSGLAFEVAAVPLRSQLERLAAFR